MAFGFAAWLFSAIVGAGYLGRSRDPLGKLVEERGPDDPEYLRRLRRVFLVSRIELTLRILVLDMTVKPGLSAPAADQPQGICWLPLTGTPMSSARTFASESLRIVRFTSGA